MSALNYPCNKAFRQALKPAVIISLVIIAGWATKSEVCAEKLDEEYNSVSEKLEKKLGEQEKIHKELNEISEEISKLAAQSSFTQNEIDQLQTKIDGLETQIDELNKNLEDRKKTMSQKETLRNTALRNLSKKSLLTEWEKFIGSSRDLSSLSGFEYATFTYIFDRALSKDALNWIKVLNEEILDFEANKAEALNLKAEIAQARKNLVALKAQLDGEKGELEEKEGEKTEKLLSLEEEIAKLSAKQKAILEQKYGSGTISGYDAPEYKLPDCPFDKGFALMSYGAFTHRYGMSQFGAKGRAEDGQDYEDIIEFYYGEKVKEKEDFPKKIKVQGYGEMDFQKYLYGLAEMSSSWPEETLKAQAVAARSYAYKTMQGNAYRQDGGICTTQSCQVFLESKVSDSRAERWHEAVDDTKNEIIGGSMNKTGYGWYSSTTGGWIHNVGWDGDWPNGAYEKKAKSPWFYKAWYNYTKDPNSSNTCGRSTPWLSEDEMADILNAWVVWRKGSDDEKKHVTPETTSCWDGDPYDKNKMADKADKYGEKYEKIYDVDVSGFSNGKTGKVCFDTNRGDNKPCIDGQEFAIIANLRAPGYISIRTDNTREYFLFDIEMDN